MRSYLLLLIFEIIRETKHRKKEKFLVIELRLFFQFLMGVSKHRHQKVAQIALVEEKIVRHFRVFSHLLELKAFDCFLKCRPEQGTVYILLKPLFYPRYFFICVTVVFVVGFKSSIGKKFRV